MWEMKGLHFIRKLGVWSSWFLVVLGAVSVALSFTAMTLFQRSGQRSVEAFEQAQRSIGVGADADASSAAAYRTALIAADMPEGVLRIPSLDLRVPVYTGTDEIALSRGAGRIDWTPPLGSDGNVGIAAHRDGAFAVLKSIALGDDIYVDWHGGSLRYEVIGFEVVGPGDVHVLDPAAEPRVTLVTCYPFDFVGAAPLRFIVHAELSVLDRAAELQASSAGAQVRE